MRKPDVISVLQEELKQRKAWLPQLVEQINLIQMVISRLGGGPRRGRPPSNPNSMLGMMIPGVSAASPAPVKKRFSDAARMRMAAAQKKRWRLLKKAQAAPKQIAAPAKPAKSKKVSSKVRSGKRYAISLDAIRDWAIKQDSFTTLDARAALRPQFPKVPDVFWAKGAFRARLGTLVERGDLSFEDGTFRPTAR